MSSFTDMGTSLGYGQTMDYQYYDAPQPSQRLPKLQRLQQLRQERTERKQQQNPEITTMVNRRKGQSIPPLQSIRTSTPPPERMAMPAGADEATVLRRKSVPDALVPASEPAQNTAMLKKIRVGRATMILTVSFIASRVLGLLRTAMFTGILGSGKFSDAYIQASLIPDTVFAIVAGGALSSAFIPVFTRYMTGEQDEDGAWHIANTALTVTTTIMIILAAIAMIFAPAIIGPLNPDKDPATVALMASLMRIMFLQSIILGAGVIVNAVLNAQQEFTLPAIGIILYNIGPVVGLLPGLILNISGHPNPTFAVYCASMGIVLAAALQVGVQIPGLAKVGMHFKPSFDWKHPAVIQIGRQMLPRILNAAMLSSSIFVDRYLIGLLGVALIGTKIHSDGLNTDYYQAFQLVLLPVGIFGQAMTTAAFPTLAEYVSRKKMDRVRDLILETLRSILYLSIPSSIGLIILGLPVIQALLQHGAFSLEAANATSIPLAFFAIGLAGMAAVEVLTRSFYAMSDTKTPVAISVGQFIFKIALAIVLLDPFVKIGGPYWGLGALALSTSLANLLEAVYLFWVLHLRIGNLLQRSLLVFLGRVSGATIGLGISLIVIRFVLDLILNTTNPGRPLFGGLIAVLIAMLKVGIEVIAGAFIYLRLSRLLGIEEMGPVRRLLDRFKLSWMI
ncbi:lipid II flippase MurJ [Tengunoibacter tsumagoiensis]|uniref:Probable lipid II flippase MurJ n=2 Tax=Tengunoibacter tsumagoiensis TaxID=2014871 RepID=A0A401ZV48_9CHLR|nr:lipid II flippase MurJ [Tengunoibacter tsumagoiensis]